MPEIGPSHPPSYRQEVVKPIFDRIQAGGSCTIAGAASMGKSRLLQHILRPEIRRHYLGDQAESTLLIWVDCNRLAEFSAWGLYELMLTGIVESFDKKTRKPYEEMRDVAITSESTLLAQRKLEMAVRIICQEEEMRIFFILDEFDPAFASIDAQCFANLRAIRDMYKYSVGYILFMRDHPMIPRNPVEVEGFYELVSRNVIGLTPYNSHDALGVVAQMVERRKHELGDLPSGYAEELIGLSGGHPGMILALMDGLTKSKPRENNWLDWATGQPNIIEECRKIWGGLRRSEQETLSFEAQGVGTGFQQRESLLLKGLIHDHGSGNIEIFSSLFRAYLNSHAALPLEGLRVEVPSGIVYINGKPTQALTNQEFTLISYMYGRCNQICSSNELLDHLYDGDQAIDRTPNAVAALIRRVRQKIEPDSGSPRYLLNARGMGYKLVAQPDEQIPAVQP